MEGHRYQVVFPDGRKENIDQFPGISGIVMPDLSEEFKRITGRECGAHLSEEGFKLFYIGPIKMDLATGEVREFRYDESVR